MPIRIQTIPSISGVIREADPNSRPDLFIVDKEVTANDVVLVKNRVPGVKIILADDVVRAGMATPREILPSGAVEDRAVDQIADINLNMMSQNPVFLARVHLRQVDIAKVKQLLLDFDMSTPDAGFIHTFIAAMIKKTDTDESLRSYKPRLEELADDFLFYIAVMNRNEQEVDNMINSITDIGRISSYMTLVAKVRSMLDNQNDIFLVTEFENRILEKKEQIQG
jgi:hypothetical protein